MNEIYSNNFYVYFYLRRDGTPYYVGKGKDKRAWIQHRYKGRGVHTPSSDRIVIVYEKLTELWAFKMERWFIRWYGRKDNNTGILHNLSDGGEGAIGRFVSDHERELRRESMLGEKHPRFGVSPSTHSNELRRVSLIGLKRSEENVQNLKGNTNRRDKVIHFWQNIETGEIVKMTRHDFHTTYKLPRKQVMELARGSRQSVNNWQLFFS